LRLLKDPRLHSWSDFDDYSRNVLRVGLNVPVPYHDGWVSPSLNPVVHQVARHIASREFSLSFDGSEVRKPIAFNPPGKAIIEEFNYQGKHVSAQGYFYGQHTTIRPKDLQGLLIRIRDAAVGEYDPSFMGFSPSLGPLLQSWISAEILADDRLEDAMNIDRRTLRVAHSAYDELQEAVHNFLSTFIKQVRKEIYHRGSEARRSSRAKEVQEGILRVASDETSDLSRASARYLGTAWRDVPSDPSIRRRLLRRYTVDELYAVVIQAAREVLSQSQLERFVRALTSKLRGE
jgi:hypothetical protein